MPAHIEMLEIIGHDSEASREKIRESRLALEAIPTHDAEVLRAIARLRRMEGELGRIEVVVAGLADEVGPEVRR